MEDRKDLTSEAGPPPPQLDLAAIKAAMERWVSEGWQWDDARNSLIDPADRRRFVHIDPNTHRPTLSPELARHLAGGLDHAASGEQP